MGTSCHRKITATRPARKVWDVETALTAVLVIASGALAGAFGYWTIRTGRNR